MFFLIHGKFFTLDVSSSNAGYAALSNSLARASRKLQIPSSATSRARNSKGNSAYYHHNQVTNESIIAQKFEKCYVRKWKTE